MRNETFFRQAFVGVPWMMETNRWRALLGAHGAAEGGQPQAAAVVQPARRSPVQVVGRSGKIGLLSLSGPLLKGVDPELAEYFGYAAYERVHEAAADVRAAGLETLIVHLDSPGGMCMGCDEAAERLVGLAGDGIRTIAYSDTLMCSAAYALGAACEEIVMAPSAYVGSIGALCLVVDVSGFWEQEGVKFEYFVTEGSEAKLYGASGQALSTEARGWFQQMVDTAGNRFKNFVQEQRPGLARENMDGSYWAAYAAPAGYVDHMHYPLPGGKRESFGTIGDLVAVLDL